MHVMVLVCIRAIPRPDSMDVLMVLLQRALAEQEHAHHGKHNRPGLEAAVDAAHVTASLR
jgi:hypothetical protein